MTDINEELNKLLIYVVLGEGGIKLAPHVQERADKAKSRLLQLIEEQSTKARIDELKRLSKTRWTDIAYDISGYLKDRTIQLKQPPAGGGE